MVISREEIALLTRPLIGLEVARAYQGYGSTVLTGFGRLMPATGRRQGLRAEASLRLEWDWRFVPAARLLSRTSRDHKCR